MELYGVKTVLPEYSGHRDVVLAWFVIERDSPVKRPYAELAEGYDPADEYAGYLEGAIDELFTRDEAEALLAWLKANRNETHNNSTIVEHALPIANNSIGLGAIPVGGGPDYLMPHEIGEGTFPLPFKVYGYFDLRAHEPIDKSVPARHQFCSIHVIDGKPVHDYAELIELWRAGKILIDDLAAPF